MPRRKGHGIPPTKRVKTEHHRQVENDCQNLNSVRTNPTEYSMDTDISVNVDNKIKRNNCVVVNAPSPKNTQDKLSVTGFTGNRLIKAAEDDGNGTDDDNNNNNDDDEEEEEEETRRKTANNSPVSKYNDYEGTAATSLVTVNSHNKYLHKKFKKMASTVLSCEETVPSSVTALNGSRVKSVLCPVPINNNFNSDNLSTAVLLEDNSEKKSLSLVGLTECSTIVEESPPTTGRYTCPYCKLVCAKPSVLQKHIRAHTNERPYPCTPCGFAFKTKSNLYKHCRSRAHTLKMEELGVDDTADKFPLPLQEDNDAESSNDGDRTSAQINSESRSVSNSDASVTDSTVSNKEGKKDAGHKVILYKPKFHTASIYLDNNESPVVTEENRNSCEKYNPGLLLKIPSSSGLTSGSSPTHYNQSRSTPSPFTSGSSPSPEFLHRHITKLISENQAIVETMDPFWPKKFLQRANSKETPSRLHSASPTSTEIIIPKKYQHRLAASATNEQGQISNEEYNYTSDKTKVLNPHSKLALALLGSQRSISPNQPLIPSTVPGTDLTVTLVDQQPLNLSTNYKKEHLMLPASIVHIGRKRSYSEGFPSAATKCPSEKSDLLFPPQTSKSLSNTQLNVDSDDYKNDGIKEIADSLGKPDRRDLKIDNQEGSIIKDLLLKARAVSSGSGSGTHYEGQFNTDVTNSVSVEATNNRYTDLNQFVCQFCNVPYRNAQNLEFHQLYYCHNKEPVSVSLSANSRFLNESPAKQIVENKQLNSTIEVMRKNSLRKEKRIDLNSSMISPPFPSPGPLLGNTPLVDNSYMDKMNLEMNKGFGKTSGDVNKLLHHDLGNKPISMTLRSLEELSKCPMRSNSLQMFGGEVKILDNAGGETKTMRIEPSNRTPDIQPAVGSNKLTSMSKSMEDEKSLLKCIESAPPQIVTIAKTGLHSGGTIVQLPVKDSVGDDLDENTVESSASTVVKTKLSLPVKTVTESTLKYSQAASKLIIPIIPNLSVPGIPFVPFTSILTGDSSHSVNVINPLSNITGYNPLTLPVSNANTSPICSPYSGGIVTILHGGKPIPYVPGMPGPQTLIQTGVPTTTASEITLQTSKLTNSAFNNGRRLSVQNIKADEDKVLLNSKLVNSSRLNKTSTDQSRMVDSKNEANTLSVNTVPSKLTTTTKRTITSPLPVISIERVQSMEKLPEDNQTEKRFLRPNSLPLKPGTFTPKRHTLSTPSNVLPLVSPETPRPRKSYGQLYLNGHAYTYLGLKCSTRVFFCTLNKPQPIYVPLSPEHSNISMYSNWKVCSDADPNPFGLDPGKAMTYYDSRHRPGCYTIARTQSPFSHLTVTHSTYWNNNGNVPSKISNSMLAVNVGKKYTADDLSMSTITNSNEEKEECNVIVDKENTPKRVKIFAGGFESNEDYIYIRGRGRGRYVCEECGIRCKKPSMLKKHIRTHTDVRPFTCQYCTFSFKTKGNLTKHMKSKAHYKRCVELGFNPVPTLVDDMCINEEMLAKQQAMRADQGLLDTEDSDEEDEEEDEEDDDDDDEDDDEEDDDDLGDEAEDEFDAEDGQVSYKDKEGASNDWNSQSEREAAAHSLLSLAVGDSCKRVPHPLSAQSGLTALHPCMYPYSFTYVTPTSKGLQESQPQTPTLTAMTAQREREKVSHNTGLARDLRSEEQQPPSAQKSTTTHFENGEGAVASRYYFPSVHRKFDKCLSESESKLRTPKPQFEDRSPDKEMTSPNDTFSDAFSSSAIIVTAAHSFNSNSSSNNNNSSEYTNNNVVVERDYNSDSNSVSASPIDLSSKTSDNGSERTNIRSQVQTCEAALLLASLCSTVDSLPNLKRLTTQTTSDMTVDSSIDDAQNNYLLHAYITERAVRQQTIRQQQSYVGVTTSNINIGTVESGGNTITSNGSLENPNGPFPERCSNKTTSSVTLSSVSSTTAILKPVATSTISGLNDDSDVVSDSQSLPAVTMTGANDITNHDATYHVTAKENALDILVKSTDAAKKHALKTSSETSTNHVTGSPNKKLKAEFLPPSSGPSPSYISILEDGRSMCLICNRVFTKPSQMRLHVNIHYFERPFRCESCAVSFRTKGHLQKHQRSVTHLNKMSMNSTFGTATTSNPRPFKCDDCKIAFRIHGHLAKHLRSKMHIMKLECLGKLPFGTYAEMERSGVNMNDIDTSDCENSLESLQILAQKLYEKDPSKLGQWDPNEMMPPSHSQSHRLNPESHHDTSSEDDEILPPTAYNSSATTLSSIGCSDTTETTRHYVSQVPYQTLNENRSVGITAAPVHVSDTVSHIKTVHKQMDVDVTQLTPLLPHHDPGSSSEAQYLYYLKKKQSSSETPHQFVGAGTNNVVNKVNVYSKGPKHKSDVPFPKVTTTVKSDTYNYMTTNMVASAVSVNNLDSSKMSQSVIQRLKCNNVSQQTRNNCDNILLTSRVSVGSRDLNCINVNNDCSMNDVALLNRKTLCDAETDVKLKSNSNIFRPSKDTTEDMQLDEVEDHNKPSNTNKINNNNNRDSANSIDKCS